MKKLIPIILFFSLLLTACSNKIMQYSELQDQRNVQLTLTYETINENIFSNSTFETSYNIPIAFDPQSEKIYYYTYFWDTENPFTINYYSIKDKTHQLVLTYPYEKKFGYYHLNMDLYKKGQWSNNNQYLAFIVDFTVRKTLIIYDNINQKVKMIEDVNNFTWTPLNELIFSQIIEYVGGDQDIIVGDTKIYFPQNNQIKKYTGNAILIEDFEDLNERNIYQKYLFSQNYKYVLVENNSKYTLGETDFE